MMMHVVVFSGDGVQLVKSELASTAQVHYLSLIQRWDIFTVDVMACKMLPFRDQNVTILIEEQVLMSLRRLFCFFIPVT